MEVVSGRNYMPSLQGSRMGRNGMHIGFWWEGQKERDNWEGLDVDGMTVLKWTTFKKKRTSTPNKVLYSTIYIILRHDNTNRQILIFHFWF
jgi:hypothetical protein